MIIELGMSKEFWVEAIRTANYEINIPPSANFNCVPAELWYQKRVI